MGPQDHNDILENKTTAAQMLELIEGQSKLAEIKLKISLSCIEKYCFA